MIKKDLFKYVIVIVALISMASIIKTATSLQNFNKFYYMEAETIANQYADKNYTAFSLNSVEKDKEKVFFFLLCGSEPLNSINISENQTDITVSTKINFGDVKLLAENIEDKSIVTTILKDGGNSIVLDAGEYNLYAVGRNFCGEIGIENK